jgi:hypothetical protein
MKTTLALKTFLCLTVAILFAGCATHRINWDSRVGSYTFNQAVTELGPPAKQAKSSTDGVVAEWITRYNGGGSVAASPGFYRSSTVGYVDNTGPSYYESKLRLTFNTNNVLTSWSQN